MYSDLGGAMKLWPFLQDMLAAKEQPKYVTFVGVLLLADNWVEYNKGCLLFALV
ncbi:hypothetical protein LguiB_013000 [Lonicera macranthoides]